ncbi:MAG: helix-turn-helix transcriptional regulator [Spirochaetota bacterium]
MESGENPNPTVDTLERIAKALGVSIEKLFKE